MLQKSDAEMKNASKGTAASSIRRERRACSRSITALDLGREPVSGELDESAGDKRT
jgi:hypothetical protein